MWRSLGLELDLKEGSPEFTKFDYVHAELHRQGNWCVQEKLMQTCFAIFV